MFRSKFCRDSLDYGQTTSCNTSFSNPQVHIPGSLTYIYTNTECIVILHRGSVLQIPEKNISPENLFVDKIEKKVI